MTEIRDPDGQHTVSRVVLRQFAMGRNKSLTVYDRTKGRVFRTGPGAVFKCSKFIAHDAQEAENRWGLVETRLPKAYLAVESRQALEDPATLDILRDVLALHWARSPATRALHEKVGDEVLRESRLSYARQPEVLRQLFRARTGGLHPGGIEALQWVNEDLHRIPPDTMNRFFAERNAVHYQQAREYFARFQIQIGYASQGEFLIGDAPVVTLKHGHNGRGPHQGVPLLEADEVVMPISPDVVIGLARQAEVITLTPEQVTRVNEYQWQSFIRYIGCRPGGDGDRWLREVVSTSSPG